jgi:hypothetical protein
MNPQTFAAEETEQSSAADTRRRTRSDTSSHPASPASWSSSRARCLLTTYQAGKLMAVRAQAGRVSTLLRTFDRPMGLALQWRHARAGYPQRRLVPAQCARHRSSARSTRRPYDACFTPAAMSHHGRHPGPRDELGTLAASRRWRRLRRMLRRTSCGWSTPGSRACAPCTPTTASSRVGAPLRLRPRRRRSLPPQRAGHGRWPAALRHGTRAQRHAEGLEARQG